MSEICVTFAFFRQRQLEALKKVEERIKSLDSSGTSSNRSAFKGESVKPDHSAAANNACTCHRLSPYVLDISQAISEQVVTWLEPPRGTERSSLWLRDAPEETILYSLVRGRAELILFGGIQKDVSSMTSGRSTQQSASDTVSNSVYFLVPPRRSI